MATSLPPGLLEFLKEQRLLEQEKFPDPYYAKREPNIQTSSANKAAVQKGGVFSQGLSKPVGNALRGLGRFAGAAATPVGIVTSFPREEVQTAGQESQRMFLRAAGLPDEPGKVPSREELEQLARVRRTQKSGLGMSAYGISLDDLPMNKGAQVTPKTPVPTRPNSNTVEFLPEELLDIAQSQPENSAVTVPFEQQTPRVDSPLGTPEEIPPEMLVEAQPEDVPPEMLVEARVLPQATPPRVEEFPESRQVLASLRGSVGERPAPYVEQPKSFLRKVGDFFRAGSRNPQLDQYNAALDTYMRQNALTDREKVAAGIAEKDIFSARSGNLAGEMAKYAGQGVSPEDRYLADLARLDEESQRIMTNEALNDERQAKRDERLHGYRLEEGRQSAAAQKLTPDAVKSQAAYELMTSFPDLFTPEQIQAATGIIPTAEGLTNLSKSRQREDPFAKFMTIQQILEGRRGRSSGRQLNLQDSSMLETKK